MPHRHKCAVCGAQAVASDEGDDGELIYLCAEHIPVEEVDPITGKPEQPPIHKTSGT